ncbi:hypothetical protein [Leptospira alstonii]|uniref:Uncharacterized protein n=2 Tax=Leptospira alstonii TaxID=28452 RepID=M6CMY2_9LEPT|nr:hypothetical protein [Leptospira alstonii]EMJ91896.1 hypothetical protein LEP1GSC194_4183 [Leptospira alstonii serovar Sichuan str. 79601]EQA82273.1 hypothetical protein LEP1GSC193_3871 [Leptospira alstonii serovar Pingchang str. 80-412]
MYFSMFRIITLFILFSSSSFGESLKLDSDLTNEILKHVRKDHKVSWQNIEAKIDFKLLKNLQPS